MESELRIEYVEAKECRTIGASGFVLTANAPQPEMLQLTAFADLARLEGEVIAKRGEEDGKAIYEVTSAAQSVPYREMQVRILVTKNTLRALSDLINNTLKKMDSEPSENPGGDKGSGHE